MKILVSVKRVPDPETVIKIAPDGGNIVGDNVKWVINPFDEIAIEESLHLKEKVAGTEVVLVVSKGPPGVKMPDVTGMAAADAVKALQERRLVPTIEQKTSTEAPGTVLAQDPKPGKRASASPTV